MMRAPIEALRPFVAGLGYVRADLPDGLETKLPTGAMQLVVNLEEDQIRWYDARGAHRTHGAALCGAVARPLTIDMAEQRHVAYVAFHPGGTHPFIGPPVGDPVVGLDALWGRHGALVRERLLSTSSPAQLLATLENILLERAFRPLDPHPTLTAAVAAIEHGSPVATIADDLGLSQTHLVRLFSERVGLTPKRFGRVRRLQRLLAAVPADGSVDWARTAPEHGYFDQPHLINDFRALTGFSPGAYHPRSPAERNHLPHPVG